VHPVWHIGPTSARGAVGPGREGRTGCESNGENRKYRQNHSSMHTRLLGSSFCGACRPKRLKPHEDPTGQGVMTTLGRAESTFTGRHPPGKLPTPAPKSGPAQEGALPTHGRRRERVGRRPTDGLRESHGHNRDTSGSLLRQLLRGTQSPRLRDRSPT
jgi:hypothetical protein